MSKRKLKVGDRVRILDGSNIENYQSGWYSGMKKYVGKIGTIKSFFGSGALLNEFGLVFDLRGLEFVEETIVIYKKDNKVIALDKRTLNQAIAKCNPVDEFDFNVGAKLAFERLMSNKKQEEKLLNTKICIVETTCSFDNLTVGKIYEIKDGKFRNDIDSEFPSSDPLRDIEDLKLYFRCIPGYRKYGKIHYGASPVKFVEIVE